MFDTPHAENQLSLSPALAWFPAAASEDSLVSGLVSDLVSFASRSPEDLSDSGAAIKHNYLVTQVRIFIFKMPISLPNPMRRF